MNLLTPQYLPAYQQAVESTLAQHYARHDFNLSAQDLGYRTAASAVFSANIEGNSLDLNSFMNSRLAKIRFKPHKEIKEIEHLIQAYQFAQQNPFHELNLLKCHALLAQTLLVKNQRGRYRLNRSGVFSPNGLVYLAIEPEFVGAKMAELFTELKQLLTTQLTLIEQFYFAAMLHLRLVQIHPFADGNGRTARLVEKWFLAASGLGERAWQIYSEKYYKEHQADYYHNLNLGVNYYELNDDLCLPFLLMLPQGLMGSE